MGKTQINSGCLFPSDNIFVETDMRTTQLVNV